MKTQWFAGKNKHTGEWTTGGTLEDYPIEHWDHWVVLASDRDEAKKKAQQKRQSEKAKERRQSKSL